MTPAKQLEQIRQTIKTLESFEEHTTESFRIVLLTLKQKKTALEKEVVQSGN
jgi:hypothetical protein